MIQLYFRSRKKIRLHSKHPAPCHSATLILTIAISRFSKQGTFHRSIAMVINETTNYDFILPSKSLSKKSCKRRGSSPKRSITLAKPCLSWLIFSRVALIIHKPDKQIILTRLADNLLKIVYHAGFKKIELWIMVRRHSKCSFALGRIKTYFHKPAQSYANKARSFILCAKQWRRN